MEKLLLLHGPGINSSRRKLTDLRKGFDPADILVFGPDENLGQILINLQTPSLFTQERLFILENPPEDFTLENLPINSTLVLWFDHQIDEKKPVMGWVRKQGQVLFFEEVKEVSVFPFLDALGMKDKNAFLKLQQLGKTGADTGYIVSMILYLLRTLVVPNKNAPAFVKEKVLRQKKNFSDAQLISFYKFVLETDFKIKSGLLEPDQAQFLLVNKFVTD